MRTILYGCLQGKIDASQIYPLFAQRYWHHDGATVSIWGENQPQLKYFTWFLLVLFLNLSRLNLILSVIHCLLRTIMPATPSLPFYQVDAFIGPELLGNPAAVLLVDAFPDEHVMGQIAAENNLSETVFVQKQETGFAIRWFTPETEVGLCGHATLAAAAVLHEQCGELFPLRFHYKSGELLVEQAGEELALSLPVELMQKTAVNQPLCSALAVSCSEAYAGFYYTLVLSSEAQVREAQPDFSALRQAWPGGVIITAAADEPGIDFVSRFFAPGMGIDEDPVTGSAHCLLAPYWAKHLGKKQLQALQLSPRGGKLGCEVRGDRVILTGKTKLVIKGEYYL